MVTLAGGAPASTASPPVTVTGTATATDGSPSARVRVKTASSPSVTVAASAATVTTGTSSSRIRPVATSCGGLPWWLELTEISTLTVSSPSWRASSTVASETVLRTCPGLKLMSPAVAPVTSL